MEKELVITLLAILFFIGALLMSILLPLSFSVLLIDEYGIIRSTWSETLTYEASKSTGGRYFTGLYGKFIKFPATKGLIEFRAGYDGKASGILKGGGNDLQGWTKEGTNVYVDASYYFSLNKDKLVTMYKEYGDDWQAYLVRLSFAVLKATTVEFETNKFITESKVISDRMEQNLKSALTSNFSGAVNLDSFQLQRISFDDSLDTAINNKLIQAFKKKSYEYQKQILVTKKETEKEVGLKNNQINEIIATNGEAEAAKKELTELGIMIDELVTAMTAEYQQLCTDLGCSGVIAGFWELVYTIELKISSDLQRVFLLDNGVVRTISAI